MNKILYNLKESRIFQFIVISIIILNAITIGVNTYDLSKFTKKPLIALGGINKNNIKKLKLINGEGFAGITYFKKYFK